MYKTINKLKKISKNINIFMLDNNELCVERSRKNNINDAFLYRLYYTEKESTQEKATIKLNKFKPKNNVSRQSLVKKENKLTIDFYEKLSKILKNEIDKEFIDKYSTQIFAVDGTYPTFLNSLSNDGYKSNKTNGSVTPLVTGIFNITSNFPVMLHMTKDKNERKAFMELMKNNNEYENNIFVFDRGYLGEDFFNHMNKHNLFYICRIKENSSYISKTHNDIIIENNNNNKIRIINYKINNKNYYIATNLLNKNEHTISVLKQIYHKRWSIEEYFKYIKMNMNISKNNEKQEKNIKKTLLANLIISQIAFLFVNLNKSNKNKIVNKSILTTGLYDNFLYKLFTCYKFTKYFIMNFINIYVKYIGTNKNKSNKRICKRTNFKSYFKKYIKNVKSKNL